MASSNEKLFKTMAYAVVALTSIITFGSVSQLCGIYKDCSRYTGATVALFVFSFLLSMAVLALWFVAEPLAAKLCTPLSVALFVLMAVGLAVQVQITLSAAGTVQGQLDALLGQSVNGTVNGDIGMPISFVGLVFALLVLIYNLNNLNVSVKVQSKAEASEPAEPGTATAQEGESQA